MAHIGRCNMCGPEGQGTDQAVNRNCQWHPHSTVFIVMIDGRVTRSETLVPRSQEATEN